MPRGSPPLSIKGLSDVAATAAVILAVRAILRIAPGRLLRWGSTTPANHVPLATRAHANIDRLALAVDRAGNYLTSTCLERALALVTLLRLRHWTSTDAKVVIGARTEPAFQAHAWVESGGRLFGRFDEAYASLLLVRHHRRQRD